MERNKTEKKNAATNIEASEEVNNLIRTFDELVGEDGSLSEEEKLAAAGCVSSTSSLETGLPALLKKSEEMKQNVIICDRRVKDWQASKKAWESKNKALMDVLGTIIKDLNIPGSSIKADGIRLATSHRTSLEVDEDWLLGQYSMLAFQLQQQLPDYVKVSMSVDKTKLATFLKTDNSMLLSNPDRVHTRESATTTIR